MPSYCYQIEMQLVNKPMMIRYGSSSQPGRRTVPRRLPVGFC
jgi:hypothetical protein